MAGGCLKMIVGFIIGFFGSIGLLVLVMMVVAFWPWPLVGLGVLFVGVMLVAWAQGVSSETPSDPDAEARRRLRPPQDHGG
jgi:membrane protein implicated in regulation of membrane protease activity